MLASTLVLFAICGGCKQEVKIGNMTEEQTVNMLQSNPKIPAKEREEAIKNVHASFRAAEQNGSK